MAINNPVGDRYNPPGNRSEDFEEIRFSEVELEDLFWLTNVSGKNNPPYRKIDDGSGGNTRTRVDQNFQLRDIVYQRT